MCQILLSINPKHVENILIGKKKFEFRKVICKRDVDKIIVYVTFPVMRVVAEVKVENVIVGNLSSVWQQTKRFAGISYDFYEKYYNGKKNAVAYKLGKVKIYKKQKMLADFGLSFAPQSFVYL